MPNLGTRRRSSGGLGSRRAQPTRPENPFLALLGAMQKDLNGRLKSVLDGSVARAEREGGEVGEMVRALRDLCERGGKRLRPGLAVVGYRAAQPTGPLDQVLEGGVALEILQAYFLIHDDWMDRDLERRGGPTVHTHLARRFRSAEKGAAAAVLTGDYAVALATRVIADLDLPSRRLSLVLRCFAEMQLDAVAGQGLDVIGQSRDIERTYRLKTASYTVRGPLVMGALMGGGKKTLLQTLERFSLPAGIAFQLRDDLIGVFGDPALTGKPRGGDLKAGKRTMLVELALRSLRGAERTALKGALGNARATKSELQRAISILEASGAKQAVEARIEELVQEARNVLEARALTREGHLLLGGALTALTSREA